MVTGNIPSEKMSVIWSYFNALPDMFLAVTGAVNKQQENYYINDLDKQGG